MVGINFLNLLQIFLLNDLKQLAYSVKPDYVIYYYINTLSIGT